MLFWEIDLFFFKVIEFDLESLKGEEYEDDEPSLVLIHVFDEAVDVAIVMIIVIYFDSFVVKIVFVLLKGCLCLFRENENVRESES